jgi:hypothetical protein
VGHLARTSLVNGGQDTQITLLDGSTILLKGVTRLDAVFPIVSAAAMLESAPVRRQIGADREYAHRGRDSREGVDGVAE